MLSLDNLLKKMTICRGAEETLILHLCNAPAKTYKIRHDKRLTEKKGH